MKWVIFFVINIYWIAIPKKYRKSCLFKESCSHFVFRNTMEHGWRHGLYCFLQRWKQCRPGYVIIYTQSKGVEIVLADGCSTTKDNLSDKMLTEVKSIECVFT